MTAWIDPVLTRRRVLLGGAALAASTLLPGTGAAWARPRESAAGLPAGVASGWVNTTYDLVRDENLSPPAAARTYAFTAVAMYEAVVAGLPEHRSLARQLTDLTTVPPPSRDVAIDWPSALTTAAAAVLRQVLPFAAPTTRSALDTAERTALQERRTAGVAAREISAGVEHGRSVAKHLARWIARDGHAGTLGRTWAPSAAGPWSWESTPPNYRPAIEPYWSEVRPMVLKRGDEVEPAPPVPFSTEPGSPFHEQAMAPYRQSKLNTPEQVRIARFWTDNPGSFTPPLGTPTGLPSGHWMLLAQQGLDVRGADLALAVETYAKTGVALHDAFLNCWTWKYRYDLLRPITYINRYIDPAWTTLVNTPQFPEHTSGHSVASPAAAAVLTQQLGTFAFTDHSHDVRGHLPRHFTSFAHAASEAARSRLYGGIHYPHAIEAGLVQGEQLGALVLARLQTRATDRG